LFNTDEGLKFPNVYKLDTADGLISSATATLEYDKRDDRFSPSKGAAVMFSYEQAGLGGSRTYSLLHTSLKYFKKIFWGLVFRNHLAYGNLSGPGDPPFNERFKLGGANSLRGYTWFSIGKTENHQNTETLQLVDVVVGGQQQLYYQGEFEFPLITEAGIKGVLFYDTGMAEDNIDFSGFRSDVGFGFRLFSPIGPLRFEWGFPIDRRANEENSNFEFAIGAPF
jgi:outer membrane protein insertion porin family